MSGLLQSVAPSPPFPISAIPGSSTVIQLSWRPGFDGHSSITGYKLEMRRESGAYVVLEENVFVTSYTVRNLDPYITYTFKISARNAVGLSPGATVTNRTLEDGKKIYVLYKISREDQVSLFTVGVVVLPLQKEDATFEKRDATRNE